MGMTGVLSDVEPGALLCGYFAKPRAETFKLEVLQKKLPEMHKEIRRLKKIIEKICPEETTMPVKASAAGKTAAGNAGKSALLGQLPPKPPMPPQGK